MSFSLRPETVPNRHGRPVAALYGIAQHHEAPRLQDTGHFTRSPLLRFPGHLMEHVHIDNLGRFQERHVTKNKQETTCPSFRMLELWPQEDTGMPYNHTLRLNRSEAPNHPGYCPFPSTDPVSDPRTQ